MAKDYSVNINGVDKLYRYRHDNYVTVRTNMWYLRIWFWKIEQIVYCVYVVVCYVANAGLRDDWKKYTSKHDGRKRIHIDLGIGLMEYGILLDWGDVNDKETNPDWMRQKKPKPYKRGMSFFLQRGHHKRHLQ